MKINWRSYYKEFEFQHGGEPVLFRQGEGDKKTGYLLFPDGWRYSASSPTGPEYAPPTNAEQHIHLIKTYWYIRLAALEEEYRLQKDEIVSMIRAQQKLSAQLQVNEREYTETEDGKRSYRVSSQGVNLVEMTDKLKLVTVEIQACKQQLAAPTIPEPNNYEFSAAGILAILEEIERERKRDTSVV